MSSLEPGFLMRSFGGGGVFLIMFCSYTRDGLEFP